MATYSHSMSGYADFQSVGRYFALAATASALLGASLIYIGNGHWQRLAHTAADLALAGMAGIVLLGLSLLMAVAVLGSLLVTLRAKQTITVSQTGVLRKAREEELYVTAADILGICEIPGKPMPQGAILVTKDPGRQLFIPRWIGGYAACLEEIRSLGVPLLPPYKRSRGQVIARWVSGFAVGCGSALVFTAIHAPINRLHQWMGTGGLALIWIAVWFARVQSRVIFPSGQSRN